jgi:hypothetical protein
MAENTFTTQFQREAPEIEARRLGLIDEAKRLYESPMFMPAFEAAGLSIGEQQAMDLARQGIGSYEPYLQAGAQGITQGMDLTQRGALAAGAIQTAPMFQQAQDVMGYGVNTLAPMAQYESLAGAGLDDIGAGIGRVSRAGDLAGGFMQADLRPATGSIQAAQLAATQATPSDFRTSANILGGGMQGAADATSLARQAGESANQQFGQASGSVGAAQLAAVRATPSDFSTSARILGGGMQGAAGATGTAMGAAQQAAQQYGVASNILGAGVGSLFGAAQAYDPSRRTARTFSSLAEQQADPTVQQLNRISQQLSTLDPNSQEASQLRSQFQGLEQSMYQTPAEAFMNPYQQQVTQQALGEMRRQADIARQGQAAQAVGAGAFGGTREGVQRAEFERNIQDQMQQRIMQDYAQNFGQAQQAAMQGFESQQQRQLAQAQGLQQAAGQSGQLTGQQAQLAMQAAAQQFQQAGFDANTAMQLAQLQQTQQNQALQQSSALQGIGALQGQLAGQQAQVGLQVAAQKFQQAGYDANTAMQLAQLQQTQQNQALQQSSALLGIGSLQGQQALQQAQLGQSGSALVGQLGAQQAQLGLLPGQVAQTQASIAAQRAGLYGQLGQGIGALTAQQAATDLSKAQTLGSLGGQMGSLGVQYGALGEATQRAGISDVGMLGSVGLLERQNEQAQLDAIRQTQMQEIMDPYQRLGFVSDIYKGAPSTAMAMTAQTAPSASPLQTAAGLGIGALSAAAGAKTAGLF